MPRIFRPSFAFLLCLLVLPLSTVASGAEGKVIVVPPGNRSATQPVISVSSVVRTKQTNGSFEGKYRAVYKSLAGNPQLMTKIKQVAAVYGIDPIHMVGAIVGEHTYNVDVFDTLQGYYVKALAYVGAQVRFAYKGEDVRDFVKRPQFAECGTARDDYELWSCRERIWRTAFQGKTVDGKAFPDDRFQRVFFQPFFAGQTFGLGQLNPLTALTVSDVVAQRGHLPELNLFYPGEVYRAVMDPDMSLQYMAAIIARDIRNYREIAGFDISQNPGLTATLYNVGSSSERAAELAAKNKARRAKGQSVLYPQENYYGWLINAKLDELRGLL